MKEHVNFYETLKEAQMRLRGTVVMYDGIPYYVLSITNHKPDGVFRMYLQPLGLDQSGGLPRPIIENFSLEDPGLGTYFDDWLDKNPKSGYLRKMMNSPAFNRFRPFPLGMCNIGNGVTYLERQPNRKTEQGLIRTMIAQRRISAMSSGGKTPSNIDMLSIEFRETLMGHYPTAQECLKEFEDPTVSNEAVAFHRNFALVRGPIGMLFLAYKGDVVGILPNGDLSVIKLGKEFRHVKESVEELRLFNNII
jgi:hypothetical protein